VEGILNDAQYRYLVLALVLWWAFWVGWIVVRRGRQAA
jgi:hypothetical protein